MNQQEKSNHLSKSTSYAEDRALIEELQARYMYAMDFGDMDKYLATFTEDGILEGLGQKWCGHDEIREIVSQLKADDNPDIKRRPATMRHLIANVVIKIDGDKATGLAYWLRVSNSNPERSAVLDSYGHYEFDVVKVNGEWLFSRRTIYDEPYDSGASTGENPCW